MNTYITKIKVGGDKRVRIEYRFGRGTEIREMEFRVVDSKQLATNEFYYTFGRLRSLVPKLCEMQEDWEYGLTPTGLLITYKYDGVKLVLGAQIEVQKQLRKSNGKFIVRTPLKFLEIPRKGTELDMMTEEAKVLICQMIDLAESYALDHERAEPGLFEEAERAPVNVTEKPPMRRRDRAKLPTMIPSNGHAQPAAAAN